METPLHTLTIQSASEPLREGSPIHSSEFGRGIVDEIKPHRKYPMKVHFIDYGAYLFFNNRGERYEGDQVYFKYMSIE